MRLNKHGLRLHTIMCCTHMSPKHVCTASILCDIDYAGVALKTCDDFNGGSAWCDTPGNSRTASTRRRFFGWPLHSTQFARMNEHRLSCGMLMVRRGDVPGVGLWHAGYNNFHISEIVFAGDNATIICTYTRDAFGARLWGEHIWNTNKHVGYWCVFSLVRKRYDSNVLTKAGTHRPRNVEHCLRSLGVVHSHFAKDVAKSGGP